jgi:hypothetical protein
MPSDSHDRPDWELLERQARERGRVAQVDLDSGRREPGPGDLYVLRETAGLPIEWAVLERHPLGGALWRAVPADTNPLVGSEDVEVPAGAQGGPLSLRCGFGVWIAAAALAPEGRTGRISPEHVREAVHKCWQIESGDVAASALAREVDVDPEYADWVDEVLVRARGLVPSRVLQPLAPPRRNDRQPLYALAAALFAVAVCLSIWTALLRQEVSRLSAPLFEVPVQEVVLGADSRGPIEVELAEGQEHLMLVFVVDRAVPSGSGRLEIVDAAGKAVWKSPPLSFAPYEELSLVLRRPLLAPGEYRIRLHGEAGGLPLAEQVLLIRAADG